MTRRVANHRRTICRGCLLACPVHRPGHLDHDDPGVSCPLKVWSIWTGEGGVAPPESPKIESAFLQGAALWDYIHRRTLTDSLTADDMAMIAGALPGCCLPHWLDDIRENPLPATGQFAWGVARHNKVNARRHVREWTVEEALADYAFPQAVQRV
jgi:hypothetical protein